MKKVTTLLLTAGILLTASFAADAHRKSERKFGDQKVRIEIKERSSSKKQPTKRVHMPIANKGGAAVVGAPEVPQESKNGDIHISQIQTHCEHYHQHYHPTTPKKKVKKKETAPTHRWCHHEKGRCTLPKKVYHLKNGVIIGWGDPK